MMAPASGFYTTPDVGRNEVRLAYVIKKEELKKALIVFWKKPWKYIREELNNKAKTP